MTSPEPRSADDKATEHPGFSLINAGYARTFRPGRLTLGLVIPAENYGHQLLASMHNQLARAERAEALGFAALWLRDIPFVSPSFGDAGQQYDPFVYLTWLAAHTRHIALGTASIVLPLRHPAHVAKAAASVNQLAGGRLLLCIASGDRPEEYPAMNLPYANRAQAFRDAVDYLKANWQDWPEIDNTFGRLDGSLNTAPKPRNGRVPLLVTGGSQQSPDWIAAQADGWMVYPRPPSEQSKRVRQWLSDLARQSRPRQPIMQPLYLDLQADRDAPLRNLHLGYRGGIHALHAHLRAPAAAGINHVALNLRYNTRPVDETLDELANHLFPEFGMQTPQPPERYL